MVGVAAVCFGLWVCGRRIDAVNDGCEYDDSGGFSGLGFCAVDLIWGVGSAALVGA